MSRIIYTTCGTSLFTSNCWRGISDTDSIFKSQSPEREDHEKRYRDFTQKEMNNDATGRSLVDKFDKDVWEDDSKITWLTAELASLKAILKFFKSKNEPLDKSDEIILIHSDNYEGKFCAQVIDMILNEKINVGCPVERKEFKGLDPQNADSFNKALKEIWEFCRNYIHNNSNDTHIFNLTGGYKGTAILLGGLVYKEHATSNIVIFYLHETTDYQNIAVNGYIDQDFSAGYVEVETGHYVSSVGGL